MDIFNLNDQKKKLQKTTSQRTLLKILTGMCMETNVVVTVGWDGRVCDKKTFPPTLLEICVVDHKSPVI